MLVAKPRTTRNRVIGMAANRKMLISSVCSLQASRGTLHKLRLMTLKTGEMDSNFMQLLRLCAEDHEGL